jgi:hypothetical protein
LPALKVNIIIVHPRGVVFPESFRHLDLIEIRIHNIIDTDYIGSCKSNYDTIAATTVPLKNLKIV